MKKLIKPVLLFTMLLVFAIMALNLESETVDNNSKEQKLRNTKSEISEKLMRWDN